MRHMRSALVTLLATAAIPIPSDNGSTPAFSGTPATPHPVAAPAPPRHPFMAPNGRSNLHDDAYQTDTYQGIGPLGHGITATSTMFAADCGSVTFDSQGRIVTVCVGVAGPTLRMLDPKTLDSLAEQSLPPRDPRTLANLVHELRRRRLLLPRQRRTVRSSPTTTRHVHGVRRDRRRPGSRRCATSTCRASSPTASRSSARCPTGRGASGSRRRAASSGYVGAAGTIVSRTLGEPIGNSFAVDETGRRVHRHRRSAVPLRSTPRPGEDDLARPLREHRHRQARPEREGLRDDADADGHAASSRSPTTRTRWTCWSTSARAR